jgi:hypothetical protein
VPDNDELRQHMANTIARHNRRDWRLDKPSLEEPNDSIIALCMALEAMERQPEPVQVIGWLGPAASIAADAPKAHGAPPAPAGQTHVA